MKNYPIDVFKTKYKYLSVLDNGRIVVTGTQISPDVAELHFLNRDGHTYKNELGLSEDQMKECLLFMAELHNGRVLDDKYVLFPLLGKSGFGNYALIDKDDAEFVLMDTWSVKEGYPRCGSIVLHRYVKGHYSSGGPPGAVIDHINRNKFDARKENLQYVPPAVNLLNSSLFVTEENQSLIQVLIDIYLEAVGQSQNQLRSKLPKGALDKILEIIKLHEKITDGKG